MVAAFVMYFVTGKVISMSDLHSLFAFHRDMFSTELMISGLHKYVPRHNVQSVTCIKNLIVM